VTSLSVEVSRKRLEFMREVRPDFKLFGVALNPASPTSGTQLKNLQVAAEALGVELVVLKASTEQEFDQLFTGAQQAKAGGLVFTSDPYFAFRSQQLGALAVRHAAPAITQTRDFPLAGKLMSYGGDFIQSHRHSGLYAGRVLRGAKPADLPVQRVTKVELVINQKAADAIGLAFPPSLLASADRVIE
jgi:putative ABC transport system substrate-binding protein